VEIVARKLREDHTWVDVQRPVFHDSFASLPSAVDACHLLPRTVTSQVTATTTLDDRQLVVLARYHIHQFLLDDEWTHALLHELACDGSETEYAPPDYDELAWVEALSEFPDPRRQDLYHLRRLAELESVLGRERVRETYDEMAAHPPGWIAP
jgi:hypothetical protein